MAGPGNILIRIGAEGTQAIAEMGRVNAAMGETATRSQKMGAMLKKAAIPAAIALGAIALGAKHAIDAASALEKEMQKTNKVFGANSDAVVQWSEHLAKSFGLSSAEALKAANKFGNMLENLGYGPKAAAEMSMQLTQLASDLASFNNVPVDQTLAALQAGLGGATRGLKKYGIIIDSTALKQKALEMHLWSGKGAMDAHAKSAATMALILEQTGKAQGDFARHAGDAANAQKIQSAEVANLNEQLGKSLLPAYEAILGLLIRITEATAGHTTAVKIAIGIIGSLAAAILLANAGLKAYEAYQAIATAATWAWNAALDANPIGLVVVAIGALVAALVLAYTKSETFRSIVQAALNAVLVAARAVASGFQYLWNTARSAWDWIKAHWYLGAFALGPIAGAILLIATHFSTVRNVAQSAINAIVSAFGALKSAASSAAAWIASHFSAIGLNALRDLLASIVNHFGYVKNAAVAAFNAILGPIEAVINAVKRLIDWLGKIHVPKISLPHIPNPFAAGLPPPAADLERAGRARTGEGSPYYRGAPQLAGAGGLTVNFYGPTDPEGAARAINRVLRAHDVRQGRARPGS